MARCPKTGEERTPKHGTCSGCGAPECLTCEQYATELKAWTWSEERAKTIIERRGFPGFGNGREGRLLAPGHVPPNAARWLAEVLREVLDA